MSNNFSQSKEKTCFLTFSATKKKLILIFILTPNVNSLFFIKLTGFRQKNTLHFQISGKILYRFHHYTKKKKI